LGEEAYRREVQHPRKHRDIFFAQNPQLEGHVWVHHATKGFPKI
jgi:hypothetical protein